jgi:phosphoglycerol transferase MdoB-like AlkP superfamily enzyme
MGWFKHLRHRADHLVFAFATLVAFVVETALVQRKFGVFSIGFGQSKVVETWPERMAVLGIVLAAQLLLFALIWNGLAWFQRKGHRPWMFRFQFLALGLGGFLAALAAKFELLAYFSDAISFGLLKNLGGGSVIDAMLFGLSEGAGLIGIVVGALLVYALVVRWLGKRIAPIAGSKPMEIGWKVCVGLLLILGIGLLAVRSVTDVRYATHRYLAVSAAALGLEALSDFDRDGYGLFAAQRDTDPFDASRHPLAYDIPGNRIDEDGLAGDFVKPAGAAIQAATPPIRSTKHLIVLVLESARGDVIGKQVNGKVVAPTLNALAAQGSLNPRAYSHVGFTTASLKNIFTGQLDAEVGTASSLFADLKAAGYRIGVISGQPESFGDIDQTVGMKRNADVMIDADTLKDERASAFAAKGSLRIDERILLREFDKSFGDPAQWQQPTFLYINFQAAHFPYDHPGITHPIEPRPIPRDKIGPETKDWVQRTYWNALGHADAQLAALIDRLRKLGVLDQTVIAITGDHGEELFENGFLGHGHVLGDAQYQTFLALNVPGYGSATPIGLRDYRSTLVAALNGTKPAAPAPVLAYIGTLEQPTAIGMVDGEGWTSMMMDGADVRFGETGATRPYATLSGADRARADRLVVLWETERWRRRAMKIGR